MEEVKAPQGTGSVALGPTKRQIVDRLKRADATAPGLARALGMTEAGVRQHLDALAEHGLVESYTRPTEGRGRPPLAWTLTDLAHDLFPDHHDDLTVDLLAALRAALGEHGVQQVLDARTAAQRDAYRRAMPPARAALRDRAEALARLRTDEGYLAEIIDDPESDGVLLVEHHCPIAAAATACTGLCHSELELFRSVMGPRVRVERTQHMIAGDRRCAYRMTRQ